MMNMDVNCDVANEVLTFLYFCDSSFIDKIPDDVINYLTNISSTSEKEYSVDISKKLLDQNMSLECKNFITSLYIRYVN